MKKVEITLDNVIKCKKCDHIQVCANFCPMCGSDLREPHSTCPYVATKDVLTWGDLKEELKNAPDDSILVSYVDECEEHFKLAFCSNDKCVITLHRDQ